MMATVFARSGQFQAFDIEVILDSPAYSPLSERAGCHQQGHVRSKAMHQQNPPVLNFCLQCFDAVGWAAGRASGL